MSEQNDEQTWKLVESEPIKKATPKLAKALCQFQKVYANAVLARPRTICYRLFKIWGEVLGAIWTTGKIEKKLISKNALSLKFNVSSILC